MDHCNDSGNEIMHSILCVKLEPFDDNEDCTQNVDPLEPDGKVHTKVELLQDFKKEIETDGSDQKMNEVIQEDMLNNVLGDTETKIEEINIKTEALDPRGIIEDTQKQSNEDNLNTHINVKLENVTNETRESDEHISNKPTESCQFNDTDDNSNTSDITPKLNNLDSLKEHTKITQNFHLTPQILSASKEKCPNPPTHAQTNEPHRASPISCASCRKTFKNTNYLNQHSCGKNYQCDICEKSFKYRSHLTEHIRCHTGERPFKCDVCQKEFTQSSNLNKHKRNHSDSQPHACEYCDKRFVHLTHLKEHQRTHERSFVCEVCCRAFGQLFHLKEHMYTHTGQRPHVCEVCEKGFTKSYNLSKHRLTHTDVRPHVCRFCSKGCTQLSHLKKHERTHSVEKAYKCAECGKGYKQKSYYLRHLVTHTEENS